MSDWACSVFRPDVDNFVKVGEEERLQLVLEPGESVTFIGACVLRCLAGSCEVGGFVIKQDAQVRTLFSPKTQALLSIGYSAGKLSDVAIEKIHPNLQPQLQRTDCCIVELLSLKNFDPSYSLHQQQPELFFHNEYNPNYSVTGCYLIFSSLSDTLMLHIPNEWLLFGKELLKKNLKSPIVMACGQRKVGKSTFCRWLVNFLLNHVPKVAFLNLDSAQTEFSPLGILDLNVLEEPVFGPPFTHLKLADDARFMGELSPGNSPCTYIKHCYSLYQTYRESYAAEGIPLVINTMGWITGLGCEIHRHLLTFIPITDVLSFVESQPCSLEYFDEPSTFLFLYEQGLKRALPRPNPTNTNFVALPWLNAGKPEIAKANRDNMLYFYFNSDFESKTWPSCNFQQAGCIDLKKLSLRVPYSVGFQNIRVKFLPKETSINPKFDLNALNLAIVGLCIQSKTAAQSKQFRNVCVGLGIVRNIDPMKRLLYIVTPVPFALLQKVDCIMKGTLEIPSIMLQGEENLPYVSNMHAQELVGAKGPSTRQFIERKKFRQSTAGPSRG